MLNHTKFSKTLIDKMAGSEPPWMREKRLDAYAHYESLLMPHTADDDVWRRTVDMRTQDYWRRTRRYLRGFSLEDYYPSPSDNGALRITPSTNYAHNDELPATGVLEQVDGQTHRAALSAELAEQGVYFANISTALKEREELLHTYFMNRGVTLETQLKSGNIAFQNKFDALHGAFWYGGYVLYVPKNVRVEAPLRVNIALSKAEQADLSHVLIIADEGSEVVVSEKNLSLDISATGMHSGAVEIFAAPNASVTYVQLQRWNPQVWNFASHRAILQREARINWVTATFGGRLNKLNQVAVLEGIGSSVNMLGLSFTDGRQHLDVSTAQEHAAPHTSSDLLYRTVLKDRAQTAWGGNIYVYPEANYTDAYQKNDNLVLSERAHADTLPGLEIQAHEVRCTHGATAGKIDPDQLFYLMSRGLSYPQAEKLIVDGFFEPVLERIPLESVRDELSEAITQKLEN